MRSKEASVFRPTRFDKGIDLAELMGLIAEINRKTGLRYSIHEMTEDYESLAKLCSERNRVSAGVSWLFNSSLRKDEMVLNDGIQFAGAVLSSDRNHSKGVSSYYVA